jgi:glutathione S-transferase
MQITLYPFPASCSRMTMRALEEIGVDYAIHCANIRKAEQTSPAYLAIDPKGKVPAMAVASIVMTENAAMLWFLHQQFPQAARARPSFQRVLAKEAAMVAAYAIEGVEL